MISVLSTDAREILFPDDNEWEDADPQPLPVGEEGLLFTNAGDEAEMYQEMLEEVHKVYVILSVLFNLLTLYPSKRHDGRLRRDRTTNRNTAWQLQLPHLVDTYLEWKGGITPQPLVGDIEATIIVVQSFGAYLPTV